MNDINYIWEQYSSNIRDNLRERGVDADKVSIWIDDEGNVATFPIWNLSGQLIGYQYYNPSGRKTIRRASDEALDKKLLKYYTRISGREAEKHLGMWGLESFNIVKDTLLFIVEGVFDAVKIQNAGYPAIAVFGSNPREDLKEWIFTLPQKVIAIIDNDENNAGKGLIKFADRYYVVPDPFKDLGDMPQESATDFINKVVGDLKNE